MCKDRDVSSVGNMSRREMRLWRDVNGLTCTASHVLPRQINGLTCTAETCTAETRDGSDVGNMSRQERRLWRDVHGEMCVMCVRDVPDPPEMGMVWEKCLGVKCVSGETGRNAREV